MAGCSNSSLTGRLNSTGLGSARLGSLCPPQAAPQLSSLVASSPSFSSFSPSASSPPLWFVCVKSQPCQIRRGARYQLKQFRFSLSQRRRLPNGQSAAEIKALSVLKALFLFCFCVFFSIRFFYSCHLQAIFDRQSVSFFFFFLPL